MEITQVNFGGSMAIYIDGKLEMYRKAMDYQDFIGFLLDNIHFNFGPVKTIGISDYSAYWDKNKEAGSTQWTPAFLLEDLEKELDLKYDTISKK